MRSLQAHLSEFEARGVRLVAISVDTPEESRDLRRKAGYTFTILVDPKREVTRSRHHKNPVPHRSQMVHALAVL